MRAKIEEQWEFLQKNLPKWGKKSASSAFIAVFKSFNSRQFTVEENPPTRCLEYYRYEQLSPSGMALSTENFLRGNLLWEELRKDPARTLHEIVEFYRVSQLPDYLMHAADVCRYLAKFAPPDQKIAYHLEAYYFCYRFLFACKHGAENSERSETLDFQLATTVGICNVSAAGIFRHLKEHGGLHFEGLELESITGKKFRVDPIQWHLSVPPDAVTEISLCSDYSVQGLWLINRQQGVGVPAVADVAPKPLSRSLKTPGGLTLPVTIIFQIAESEDGSLALRPIVIDTSRSESFTIGADRLMPGTWLLARDFTTPFACFLNNLQKRNLLAVMLNPLEQEQISGLYMVDAYHPDKIPVVCIHGLMSSPETWGQMINSLRNVPAIRKRYQFWFYSYSTGFPIIHSAQRLAEALREAQQEFCTTPEATANFNKMVIIGHSMGGMVTRLLLQDKPEFIIEQCAQKSLDELAQSIPGEVFNLAKKALVLPTLPFVRRAIFMAVPHRGAPMAEKLLAQLGMTLTKLPPEVQKIGEKFHRIAKLLFPDDAPKSVKEFFTGIGNLNPTRRIVRALGDSPLRKDVTFHSIIGNKKEAAPGGNDGIVGYESSHIDGVASEFMVKSAHNVQKSPVAIREVLRILLLHLKEVE